MNKFKLLALLIIAMPYATVHASEELREKTDASHISSSLQKARKDTIINTTTAIEMLNVIDRNEMLCINYHPCLKYCYWSCCLMSRPQSKLREMITFNTDLNTEIDALIESNNKIARD